MGHRPISYISLSLSLDRCEMSNPSLSFFSFLPSHEPDMRMSLNSACYRTLVRIFSLCLDEQIPAPNPHPNPSVDSDPNVNSPNLEQPSESIHGPKPNGSSTLVNELAHFQIKEGATLVENPQTSTRLSESTHSSNPNSCLNCDANGNSKPGNELGHYRIKNAVASVENCQNSAQQSQLIHVQNPNPSLNCDPDGSSKLGDELSHCQVDNKKSTDLDENSSRLEEELRARKWKEEERLRAYSGVNNGEAFSNSSLRVFDAVKELELDDECVDIELFDNIMADCAKLIDGDKTGLDDQPNLEENNQCLNGNLEKDLDSDKSSTAEKLREQAEETQQETLCEGQVNGEDFEDGEIPNDFENSNQHLDLIDECKGKKLEESSESKGFAKNGKPNYTNLLEVSIEENYSRKDIASTLICASYQDLKALGDDGFLKPDDEKNCSRFSSVDIKCAFADPYTLRLSGENLKNLTNAEKEVSSKTQVVAVWVKKKRGPQTEERKAKKKIAKKRKRAQKEREQGVKRLKLQPIVKPKEVKYCNFYLVGRCQQGDLCKFSHDMTPLTKSQPCKHFACDSCLKGDDCPYDHQLSKYPCHKYMSIGVCFRGDNCKFSHKLPATEGSTTTSETCSADSIVPTKKSNFVKQLPIDRTKASSLQFVLHKPPTENLVNASKEPMHVPNGIHFISFDKKPSAAGDDRRKGRELNAMSSVQRSIHATKCEKNVMRSSTNDYTVATSNAAKKTKVDDPPRSLQIEISEASKILDEFLFCGAS